MYIWLYFDFVFDFVFSGLSLYEYINIYMRTL